MDKQYHVIGDAQGSPWVLNLEPDTYRECQSRINWQRQPYDTSGPDHWVITTYDPSRGFVDANGRTYNPSPSPYTREAWDRFFERYGD